MGKPVRKDRQSFFKNFCRLITFEYKAFRVTDNYFIPFADILVVFRRRPTVLFLQRWFELLVNLNLIASDNFVGLVRHTDNRLQLFEHFWRHSLLEGGRR